jgi:hypothetical protein
MKLSNVLVVVLILGIISLGAVACSSAHNDDVKGVLAVVVKPNEKGGYKVIKTIGNRARINRFLVEGLDKQGKDTVKKEFWELLDDDSNIFFGGMFSNSAKSGYVSLIFTDVYDDNHKMFIEICLDWAEKGFLDIDSVFVPTGIEILPNGRFAEFPYPAGMDFWLWEVRGMIKEHLSIKRRV